MLTKFRIAVVWIAAAASAGCGRTSQRYPVLTDSAGHRMGIQVSLQQALQAGVEIGTFYQKPVEQFLSCQGHVAISGQNRITLTAPVQGRIRSLPSPEGAFAEAGAVIAGLEHGDFIRLQQEYLEAVNQMTYFHQEYKRQGELTVDQATSLKKMQEAQRDYQSAEIRLHALRLQLETLGICADSIGFNRLTALLPLKAPRSGRILEVKVLPDAFVKPGDDLLVMGNEGYRVLRLLVPEHVIRYLKKGQSLDFYLTDDSLSIHQAFILRMPPRVDPVSHMAEMEARVTGTVDHLLPGMSVTARIRTPDRRVACLDTASVLQDRNGPYVFVRDRNHFVKVPVKTGASFGEITAITAFAMPEKADSIVIRGSHYLKNLLENR